MLCVSIILSVLPGLAMGGSLSLLVSPMYEPTATVSSDGNCKTQHSCIRIIFFFFWIPHGTVRYVYFKNRIGRGYDMHRGNICFSVAGRGARRRGEVCDAPYGFSPWVITKVLLFFFEKGGRTRHGWLHRLF
jgi:hypothetical protein